MTKGEFEEMTKDELVAYADDRDIEVNHHWTKDEIIKEIMKASKWKSFHASDMTRDPLTGNYVLTAAQENGILTITPEGKIVSARQLPGSMQHTEGIAITPDSLLILSDEAGKHPAAIVLYRWR
jgi:hypothetical protein